MYSDGKSRSGRGTAVACEHADVHERGRYCALDVGDQAADYAIVSLAVRCDGENGRESVLLVAGVFRRAGCFSLMNGGGDGGDVNVRVYVCRDVDTRLEGEEDERGDGMWKWNSLSLRFAKMVVL